jgi:hypothetical protein
MARWSRVACVSLVFSLGCTAAPASSDVALTSSAAQTREWQWVDPPAGFTYAGLEPSCSTAPDFSVDPTGATLFPADWRFLVRPGSTDKLVIYFEGGGACWDFISCIQVQSFFQALDPNLAEELPNGSGIFDLGNPKNPVRDWTFLFIPYCTADLHAGTRDATYGGFTIRHRGRVNTEAALAWAVANVPNAQQILVTGSSAGGYGARNDFDRIAELYPDAKLSHLGDASTLSPSPAVVDLLRTEWGASGVVGRVADYATLAARYPDAHFGLYGTEHDQVLTSFRGLFCLTVPALEVGCTGCPVCELQDDVTAELAVASATPNFRYYIAAGGVHTILLSPLFYTEASAGIPFAKWFQQLVRTPGEAPVPASVACPECLETCPRDELCPAP